MKNLIAFFEIPVTYFYQSVNFYQTILGVELMVAEYNNEKMACFVQDGQTVGTISYYCCPIKSIAYKKYLSTIVYSMVESCFVILSPFKR